MRIRRVLQGTALTALAAAAWMGAGTADASAATIPTSDIKVDTAKQEMTVKTDDAEVIFGVGNFKKNNGSVKVSAWDVYDVADATDKTVKIDLSKLSNTKDNYVVVKTEKTDPTYIRISASSKGQKLTFNAGDNSLKIELKTGSTNPSGKWQYRTSYGNWQELATKDNAATGVFKEYQPQGASLYIRAAASTQAAIVKSEDKVYDAAIKSPTEGDKLNVFDAGSLPGKETKLNIAKQANGPAISADYVKRTVKFKRNSQYRVWTAGADGKYTVSETTAAPTDVKNLSDIVSATSGVIEARIAPKTDGKGKAASKWARLIVNKSAKIVLSDKAGESTIFTATAGAVDVSTGIKVEPQKNNKGYSGKIKVTNSTGCAISVLVEGKKAVTVAKNADKTIAAPADKKIEIAIAGDKKAGIWLGEYVTIGKVQ